MVGVQDSLAKESEDSSAREWFERLVAPLPAQRGGDSGWVGRGLHGKIPKLAERHIIARSFRGSLAQDDVVEDVYFKELTGTNEISGHPDVRLGRGWIS